STPGIRSCSAETTICQAAERPSAAGASTGCCRSTAARRRRLTARGRPDPAPAVTHSSSAIPTPAATTAISSTIRRRSRMPPRSPRAAKPASARSARRWTKLRAGPPSLAETCRRAEAGGLGASGKKLITTVVALGFLSLAPAEAAAQSNISPDRPAVERRLSDAVSASPDSFEAHRALATFLITQGKLEAAIPHLQRARTIDPNDYANGYDLVLALIETGKLDAARSEVRRMLARKETGELHNLSGNIEERAGRLADAAPEYERAAHLDP